MYWLPYSALVISLIVIWLMPKRLSMAEIYASWFLIVSINFSSDVILALYLNLYDLGRPGIQLRVHLLEWTLGASYGIVYLNFIPRRVRGFIWYVAAWTAFGMLFELLLVQVHYIKYTGWKLWYSGVYYCCVLVFLRWHMRFFRSLMGTKELR